MSLRRLRKTKEIKEKNEEKWKQDFLSCAKRKAATAHGDNYWAHANPSTAAPQAVLITGVLNYCYLSHLLFILCLVRWRFLCHFSILPLDTFKMTTCAHKAADPPAAGLLCWVSLCFPTSVLENKSRLSRAQERFCTENRGQPIPQGNSSTETWREFPPSLLFLDFELVFCLLFGLFFFAVLHEILFPSVVPLGNGYLKFLCGFQLLLLSFLNMHSKDLFFTCECIQKHMCVCTLLLKALRCNKVLYAYDNCN